MSTEPRPMPPRRRTDAEMEAQARAQLPDPAAHYRAIVSTRPVHGPPLRVVRRAPTHEPLPLDSEAMPDAERLAYRRDAGIQEIAFDLARVGLDPDAPGPEGYVLATTTPRRATWVRWERAR